LDAGSSPICGFLMENELDQNLQVYDSQGEFLGWLQRGDQNVKWRSTPEKEINPKEIAGEMGTFVRAVLGWNASAFTDLFAAIDKKFENASQSESVFERQLCVGNILALVCAKIEIEEEGLALKYWGEKNTSQTDYRQVKFPVKIGDERRTRDGVAAFFVSDENGIDYSAACEAGVGLTCTLEKSVQNLSLLIDPYREITIRTGLLPVKRESLAPALYEKALTSMNPVLSHWPVLEKKADTQIQESYVIWKKEDES